MAENVASPKPESAGERIARIGSDIAHSLARASAGERSEARRMTDGCPFFWRMTALLNLPEREREKWLRYTRMAALLTPASAKDSFDDRDRSLGAVLADGGKMHENLEAPAISEHRLARLLSSRGTARLDALERTIRMIASKTRKMSATDLAKAVFFVDTTRIANAYYRRLDAAQSRNAKEPHND